MILSSKIQFRRNRTDSRGRLRVAIPILKIPPHFRYPFIHRHLRGTREVRLARPFGTPKLLVTIVVIAIFAALLLSALGSAKKQAYNANCRSNLRQLSVALRLYWDD